MNTMNAHDRAREPLQVIGCIHQCAYHSNHLFEFSNLLRLGQQCR